MTALSRQPNQRPDIAVVGAGPAGMAAAIQCAELGLSVSVFDMQPGPGGQIYRNLEGNAGRDTPLTKVLGDAYLEGAELISRFRAAAIDYHRKAIVWHARNDGAIGVTTEDGSASLIRARHIILANGAMERPAPFAGWTLPGVMTAGAAQTLLKTSGAVPAGATVVAGAGPLALLVAYQLALLGADLRAVLLTSGLRPTLRAMGCLPQAVRLAGDLAKGMSWIASLRRMHVPVITGISDLKAIGPEALNGVLYAHRGAHHSIAAQTLLVHDGLVPATELSAGAGCTAQWDEDQLCWNTSSNDWGVTDQPGISVSGDARSIGGAKAAAAHGALAALEAATKIGRLSVPERNERATAHRVRYQRAMSLRPFLDAMFPPGLAHDLPDDDTLVCRCEEITRRDISKHVASGLRDINQLKSLTRCGMGQCQGRMCALTLSRIMAHDLGTPIGQVGSYRSRFPARPVAIEALAELTIADQSAPAGQPISLVDKPKAHADKTP